MAEGTEKKEIKITELSAGLLWGTGFQISTDSKINYINTLLSVGFDSVSLGIFSEAGDMIKVLKNIDKNNSHTKILVTAQSLPAADAASKYPEIDSVILTSAAAPKSEYFAQNPDAVLIELKEGGCQSFTVSMFNPGAQLKCLSTMQIINLLAATKSPHGLRLLNFETAWNIGKKIFSP